MRKDVKTGLLIGTGLCLAGAVWFCVHQQVVPQPRMEDILLQKKHLFISEEPKMQINLKDDQSPVLLENSPSVRIHEVTSGETLSDISKIYYGSSTGWNKIYEANREQLSRGPDAIRSGMKLVIPQNTTGISRPDYPSTR